MLSKQLFETYINGVTEMRQQFFGFTFFHNYILNP